MANGISFEELARISATSNKELTDAELRVKNSYFQELSGMYERDGVQNYADKYLTQALDCIRELDERHGIFGKIYAYPQRKTLRKQGRRSRK